MRKPMLDGDFNDAISHNHSPATPIKASSDVLVNGKPVALVGDQYIGIHVFNGDPKISHPAGSALGGSEKLLINGRQVHREGDPISCGSIAGKSSAINFLVP